MMTINKVSANLAAASLAAGGAADKESTMHVAVTGATGLVGRALVSRLVATGHQVSRLVRKLPAGNAEGVVRWQPDRPWDAGALDGIQAVVHLAGENIAAARWSAAAKRRIRDSRVVGTANLSAGLAALPVPPQVLVCASAIGIYGDRGEERLHESAPPGRGFLADVVRDWEAAAAPARAAGIRVVHLRFGMILSRHGGALAKMLLPFRLGLGGPVGNGRQYWSWISLPDAVGAITHAMANDSLAGPVNVVAPEAVTNLTFTRALGQMLRRPAVLPLPAALARLAIGEMADSLLLSSVRVEPHELLRSNFPFEHRDLPSALRQLLADQLQ